MEYRLLLDYPQFCKHLALFVLTPLHKDWFNDFSKTIGDSGYY